MIMLIRFSDGTKIAGKRGSKETGYWMNHETKGTHHFTIIRGGDEQYDYLIGREIAIPISSVKYFILDYKG